jgi:hypothetical protein
MFVRFRRQRRRVNVSLVENRRVAKDRVAKDRVVAEHVGALGSVDADVSVRERLAFWAKLPQRLDKLGNRVGSDQHPRIYAAVAARIPMVTPDEQRALQEQYFADEAQICETMRNMAEGAVAGHKSIIADAEKAIAERTSAAETFAADAAAAKDKLAKLKRGESVSGGLGKKLDVVAELKKAGWTQRDMRQAERLSRLTGEEFETLIEKTPAAIKALDAALDREARRILRERGERVEDVGP